MTKTANAMSRHAAKVDRDYLRREITIHQSDIREQNQCRSCILTFKSINKDNPLTTNQTIKAIANVFGNVHGPICIHVHISMSMSNLIICKVERRHLPKNFQRNSNSSQSKTTKNSSARPKITLVPTRHAAEFMDKYPSRVKKMRPNSFGYIPSNNISE